MSEYVTDEVPFLTYDNRKCLTELQVQDMPWLADFIGRFPDSFEYNMIKRLWVYTPRPLPEESSK